MKNKIEWLLFESGVSKYQISKATGISAVVLSKYARGESKVGQMTLDNAEKIHKYYKEVLEMEKDYIRTINEEHGLNLTGLSPLHGTREIPESAERIVVKDFGNGLGRVIYADAQNRIIANNMEKI